MTESVGRFISGKVVGNRPMALPWWAVTTDDFGVATALAELFQTPVTDSGREEHPLELETRAESVHVVLDGPSAIRSEMRLWMAGKLVHHCDGVKHLSPDGKRGEPCGCPRDFRARKEAAKNYRGPSPSMDIRFRLADAPDLGVFSYRSGAWTLAECLPEYDAALNAVAGEAAADLRLFLVEFEFGNGERACYRKPVLERIRPYADAVPPTA